MTAKSGNIPTAPMTHEKATTGSLAHKYFKVPPMPLITNFLKSTKVSCKSVVRGSRVKGVTPSRMLSELRCFGTVEYQHGFLISLQ